MGSLVNIYQPINRPSDELYFIQTVPFVDVPERIYNNSLLSEGRFLGQIVLLFIKNTGNVGQLLSRYRNTKSLMITCLRGQ